MNTMNCASFLKSVVSPNSEIRFQFCFAAAIVYFKISTERLNAPLAGVV